MILLVMQLTSAIDYGLFPLSMGMDLNILGLTERLVIYIIRIFKFVLSYYYTFKEESLLIRGAGRL